MLGLGAMCLIAFVSCKENAAKKIEESNVVAAAERDAVASNFPVLEFDKKEHDFGEIEAKTAVETVFNYKNTGDAPLVITDIKSSCGCTVPEWPRQPILPGQSDVIKVKYDTKRIGAINKSVHVYSNAKVSPISLKIKGKINAKTQSQLPEKEVDKTATPVNK